MARVCEQGAEEWRHTLGMGAGARGGGTAGGRSLTCESEGVARIEHQGSEDSLQHAHLAHHGGGGGGGRGVMGGAGGGAKHSSAFPSAGGPSESAHLLRSACQGSSSLTFYELTGPPTKSPNLRFLDVQS